MLDRKGSRAPVRTSGIKKGGGARRALELGGNLWYHETRKVRGKNKKERWTAAKRGKRVLQREKKKKGKEKGVMKRVHQQKKKAAKGHIWG